MEESRKVYGWLVCGRNAAAGCSYMWTGTRGGENYCGNLLWQSVLTLLFPESDSDVGILAEYLVGDILGCLPPTRKVQSPFDLVTKSGTTIEVKATTHKYVQNGKELYYRWDANTQSEALKGNRPIADVWVFLAAAFPGTTSGTSSVARGFDLKNWTCYLVSGEQLRTAGCTRYVSEATLRRLGCEPFPLGELKKRFNH